MFTKSSKFTFRLVGIAAMILGVAVFLSAVIVNAESDTALNLWGVSIPKKASVIDLTGAEVDYSELTDVMPYLLPDLKELILNDTGLTAEQIATLSDNYPEVSIVHQVTFCGQAFPADSEEIDISGSNVTVEEVERSLAGFPKLKKLIMSDCGIDDETMDALNRRYPEIAIVWTVHLGKIALRTDETTFYCGTRGYLPTEKELQKLRYCTEMIAVDIGHLNAKTCDWLEFMPKVKYLILADTQITDISAISNLKELLYVELFALNIKDYSPLLSCTKLQDLNISSTHADPAPLSQMTWLNNLHWYKGTSDPKTRDAVLQLPQQLPNTNVMLDMVGNISNPWRNLPHYYVFRDMIGGNFLNQSFIQQNWGKEDASKILHCDGQAPFAADVLAEIIRERIDNGQPIIGIKNIGSENAERLYASLLDIQP